MSIIIRIGEAKHPGPTVGRGLTIGSINACGLGNKCDSLQDLPFRGQSIWGVCETHLTATGVVKVQQELKIKQSGFALHHGAPAPYRSTTQHAIGGKHVGAGFLTTVPCKNLAKQMPEEIFKESRVDVKIFFCQGKWLQGATCYGYAYRTETQETKQKTDQLLKYITETIVLGAQGYRFVCGDFNQPHGVLDETKTWEQLGWREVQVHLQEMQNRPIQATCKSVTTRDFVWLSPELLQHLESVEVVDHIFPDHSVVCAHLKPFFKPENVYLWRKPKGLDWNATPPIAEHDFKNDTNASTSEQMLRIAKEFEHRVVITKQQHNMNKCHPSQLGRSATTNTVKLVEYDKPITKARKGDYQPNYDGISLPYARWVKQMRRLESLCRNLAKNTTSDSARNHANKEWRGVMTATGFPRGFQKWWEQLESKHGQAPASLSWSCPTFSETQGITFTFMAELHQFENILNQELQKKAKENRITNPNKIFDDIDKPKASPIQLLEEPISTEVVAVHRDRQVVEVKQDNAFDVHQDIQHNQRNVQIVRQCSNAAYEVREIENIAVGDTLSQDRKYGSVEDIFNQFGKEWKARWDKHAMTPETDWEPICEFFRLAKPDTPSQSYQPITLEQWKQSLRRKKKRAATGPDGWSRLDLLNLPDDLTMAIIGVLTQVEQGQPWPMQTITGIVHSLEKTPNAARVSAFRPITIFSLIYRNWASIRAREALRYMMEHAPAGCYGNVPGKSATQLWLSLQVWIENCHHNDEFITGGVIDIIKCFNHLPRVPLIAACITLGMPKEIALAWQKGLSTMERRFHVRGSTGPGIRSTTGFPEGCPMSVVAMFSANCIIHEWLIRKAPMCRLWTFVDNIEITASSHHDAINGMEQLSKIVQALDLDVDSHKTYMWSTDPEGRKHFRQEGTNYKTWARDLGGQVQYTRQATNSVITQKMDSFKTRWKSVQRSQAPYKQKLKAFKVTAWTNALHGVSSATIGDENYEPLRTGAVRSLGEHHNGTSPIIHLSLVEHPSHDPAYFALWQTVIDARNHIPKIVASFLLSKLSQASDRKKPEVGPCSVLLHRLNQLLWYWEDNTFKDHRGLEIDIWEVCIQELGVRLTEGWQARVSREKAWRKTFGGMDTAFPKISKINPKLPPQKASVIRNNQNGTFYTADHLKHRAQGQSTTCFFCGKEDSVYHRLWECEELAEARNQTPIEVQEELTNLPPCTHNHGWFPEPTSLFEFRQHLQNIKHNSGHWIEPMEVPETLDLFTDGTCANPTCEFTRLGAWGVAMFQPNISNTFSAVASGLLGGIHQTVTRAELQAAIVAAHVAMRYHKKYRLWIDNAFVIKVIKIIQRKWDIMWTPGTPNHDLLQELTNVCRQTKHLLIGVHKVYSHQKHAGASPAEIWAFEGNESADKIAASVLLQDNGFLNLWGKLKEEVNHTIFLKEQLHTLFQDIAEATFRKSSSYKKSCQDGEMNGDLRIRAVAMEEWRFPEHLPAQLSDYSTADWANVFSWVTTMHDPEGTPKRWSWFQMYLDFKTSYPSGGPWYHSGTKQWRFSQTRPRSTFLKEVRWFNSYITRVGQHVIDKFPINYQIPDSCYISFRTKTLPVQIKEAKHLAIERLLGQWKTCFATPKELLDVMDD